MSESIRRGELLAKQAQEQEQERKHEDMHFDDELDDYEDLLESLPPALQLQEQQEQSQLEVIDAAKMLQQQQQQQHKEQEQKQKKEEVQEQKRVTVNIDDLKIYIQKCVSRQNISTTALAAMESDFFDKVKVCASSMNESSFFHVETFINMRLDLIVQYAKEFSENVYSRLTSEEAILYRELCDSVRKYRETVADKLT